MIPPRAEGKDEPFLLLLNGAKLIPLNLSWAILLANFMAALEHFFTEGDNAPDHEVKQADWERLAAAIPACLRYFIEKNRISPEEYWQTKGQDYRNTPFLRVYGRAGQACAICGASLQRIAIGGRSSVFCPVCQGKT